MVNDKKTAPSSPGGSPRKKVRNHSSLPVTVKQLLEAQQLVPDADEFLINNREIHEVYIVGVIVTKEELSTSLNYLIDDGTGQINVRIWLPKDVESNYLHLKASEWVEGSFVRAIGNLRIVVKGKRSLVAFRLIRVEDFNEISYHALECIYVHLYFQHGGALGSLTNKGALSPVKPNIYSQSASIKTNYDSPVKYSQKSSQVSKVSPPPKATNTLSSQKKSTPAPSTNANDAGLSFIQKAIMQVIRAQSTEIGLSIEEIVEEVKRDGVDEDKIRREIALLLDYGECYYTIDDNHVQVTT